MNLLPFSKISKIKLLNVLFYKLVFFKKILSKYNPKLRKVIDSKVSKSEFNKLIKLEVLEVYDLLTRQQFKKYKNLKKNIERNKINKQW